MNFRGSLDPVREPWSLVVTASDLSRRRLVHILCFCVEVCA
jgi:hypothetical protein